MNVACDWCCDKSTVVVIAKNIEVAKFSVQPFFSVAPCNKWTKQRVGHCRKSRSFDKFWWFNSTGLRMHYTTVLQQFRDQNNRCAKITTKVGLIFILKLMLYTRQTLSTSRIRVLVQTVPLTRHVCNSYTSQFEGRNPILSSLRLAPSLSHWRVDITSVRTRVIAMCSDHLIRARFLANDNRM